MIQIPKFSVSQAEEESSTGEEKKKISNDLSIEGIISTPNAGTLRAGYCRITETNYRPLRDFVQKKKKFTSRVYLGRESINGFAVFIQPLELKESKGYLNCNVREMAYKKLGKDTMKFTRVKQFSKLVNPEDRESVTIQFKRENDCNFFHLMLGEMIEAYTKHEQYLSDEELKSLSKEAGDIFEEEETNDTYPNKVLIIENPIDEEKMGTFEDVEEETDPKKGKGAKKEKKKKKVRSGLSGISIQYEEKFYEISSEEWNSKHILSWLRHIYCQFKKSDPIMTLYDKLKRLELLDSFIKFINPPDSVGGASFDKRDIKLLFQHIENFEKDRKRAIDRSLLRVLQNENVRNLLKTQIILLNERGGKFLIRYYYVLRKVIIRQKKKIAAQMKQYGGSNPNPDLQHLENKLLKGDLRILWDIEEMRDTLFFMLLFHKSLYQWIEEEENKFYTFLHQKVVEHKEEEKKRKKERKDEFDVTDDDDDSDPDFGMYFGDEEEEGGPVDPRQYRYLGDKELELFKIALREYEEKSKISLVEFSLQMNIDLRRAEQLDLRNKEFEESENQKRIRLADKKKYIDEQQTKIDKIDQEIVSLQDESQALLDEKTDNDRQKLINVKKSQRLKGRIRMLNQDRKKEVDVQEEYQIEYANIEKQDTKPMYDNLISNDLDQNILDHEIFPPFAFGLRRRETFRRIIRAQLKEIHHEKKVGWVNKKIKEAQGPDDKAQFQFFFDDLRMLKVKLSISRKVGSGGGIKGLNALGMQLGNALFGDLVQFGPYHSSIMMSNVNINWYSNATVHLRHLSDHVHFEDIICLDTFCPFIISSHNLWEKMENVAKELVNFNVNWKYAEVNVLGLGGQSVSCQGFSTQLLKVLNYTPFSGVTLKYLESYLPATRGGEGEELRVLRIDDIVDKSKFKKKFQKVWKYGCTGIHKKIKKVGEVLVFRNHAILDRFYNQCICVDINFPLNFPSVYQLLKGFDRAFWIMYMNTKGRQDRWKPDPSGCPFGKEMMPGMKARMTEKEKVEEKAEEEDEGEEEEKN